MKKLFAWAVLLNGLLFSVGVTFAQSGVVDEADFWNRLAQTDALIGLAINQGQPERAASIAQIQALWDGVNSVRLSETEITLDLRWLQGITDNADLFTLQQRVRALLDYHAQQIAAAQSVVSSSALDDVLRDPRFRYVDITPTPAPPPPDITPSINVPGQLSQFLLLSLGIIGVVIMLLYLARNLRVQRTTLEVPAEVDDDPTTSTSADERAADLEAGRDYRTAIRYLYLSSLLMLDERGLIHYDRTLTNREHLRQITDKPQLLEMLRPVVSIFDEVWYGFSPVDESFYQQYRQRVEQLKRIVYDSNR